MKIFMLLRSDGPFPEFVVVLGEEGFEGEAEGDAVGQDELLVWGRDGDVVTGVEELVELEHALRIAAVTVHGLDAEVVEIGDLAFEFGEREGLFCFFEEELLFFLEVGKVLGGGVLPNSEGRLFLEDVNGGEGDLLAAA